MENCMPFEWHANERNSIKSQRLFIRFATRPDLLPHIQVSVGLRWLAQRGGASANEREATAYTCGA
jgi:hypothetical protein